LQLNKHYKSREKSLKREAVKLRKRENFLRLKGKEIDKICRKEVWKNKWKSKKLLNKTRLLRNRGKSRSDSNKELLKKEMPS
jgi:hypothetical protein